MKTSQLICTNTLDKSSIINLGTNVGFKHLNIRKKNEIGKSCGNKSQSFEEKAQKEHLRRASEGSDRAAHIDNHPPPYSNSTF